jgi:hypothetical protein
MFAEDFQIRRKLVTGARHLWEKKIGKQAKVVANRKHAARFVFLRWPLRRKGGTPALEQRQRQGNACALQ